MGQHYLSHHRDSNPDLGVNSAEKDCCARLRLRGFQRKLDTFVHAGVDSNHDSPLSGAAVTTLATRTILCCLCRSGVPHRTRWNWNGLPRAEPKAQAALQLCCPYDKRKMTDEVDDSSWDRCGEKGPRRGFFAMAIDFGERAERIRPKYLLLA